MPSKYNISKEWFQGRAPAEEGQSIEAGRPSALVAELLQDEKFMNRLAWRVGWEIAKWMLLWLVIIGAALWLGSRFGSWIVRMALREYAN